MAQRVKRVAKGGGEHFTRSMWRGLLNYSCRYCAFASLDALVMSGHLRLVHGIGTGAARPAAPAPAPVVLIDGEELVNKSESEVKEDD